MFGKTGQSSFLYIKEITSMVLNFLKKYSFIVSGLYMIGIALSIFVNGYKIAYTIIFLIIAVCALLINLVEHRFSSKKKYISTKSELSMLGAGLFSIIFFILSLINKDGEVYTFFVINTSIVFLIDIWYVKLCDLNGDF